jgi:hypothetical protein
MALRRGPAREKARRSSGALASCCRQPGLVEAGNDAARCESGPNPRDKFAWLTGDIEAESAALASCSAQSPPT